MNPDKPPIPAPGPPKKGFWGFVASLFPKRPQILEAPTPTSDSSVTNKPSDLNPSQSQPGQSQATDPSSESRRTEGSSQGNKSAQEGTGQSLSGPRNIDNTPLPQTQEEAAPNSEGETMPPTVATPEYAQAPTLEDNEGMPPKLPTKPSGSGGSENDPSTPDPDEPYDPSKNPES